MAQTQAVPTWEMRELVILRAIQRAQEEGADANAAAKAAVDLSPEVYRETVASLADGRYIVATIQRAWGGGVVVARVERLTPEGRRAVGQWPSETDAAALLVALLEERADAEPDPEKRGRIRQAAAAVGGVGRDVVAEVLARLVERQAGL